MVSVSHPEILPDVLSVQSLEIFLCTVCSVLLSG